MAGKSNKVTIPKTYKSGPNSHKVTATYITDAEIGLLRALDMHNSGIGTENHYGPGGLLNMDGGGVGDPIGRKVASTSAGRRLVQLATTPQDYTYVEPEYMRTNLVSGARPAASVYAGPGYRTEPADLITAGDIRKELAAPYVQTIQATTDFEYSDPWGRDRDDGGNGGNGGDNGGDNGDNGGNGGNGGNGAEIVIPITTTQPEVTESGDFPFFDIFSPYRNEQRYTGPTVLEVAAPAHGLLDYGQYMPPEGVGLRTYAPQRALLADQGAAYQTQWQGGVPGYQAPIGATYAPDYQTVDQPTSGDGTTDNGTTDATTLQDWQKPGFDYSGKFGGTRGKPFYMANGWPSSLAWYQGLYGGNPEFVNPLVQSGSGNPLTNIQTQASPTPTIWDFNMDYETPIVDYNVYDWT